jgi:hypothetical protein
MQERKPMNETLKEQPLSGLVKQLADQTSRLARLEMELAKSSLQEKGRAAAAGGSMLGVGAVLALLGLGALTACAVLALALAVDAWLAALIVGVAELVVAGIVALVGRSRLRQVPPLVPETSSDSMRDDIASVKHDLAMARHEREVER